MTRYWVTITTTGWEQYEVNAADPDVAREVFYSGDLGKPITEEVTFVEIESVQEIPS